MFFHHHILSDGFNAVIWQKCNELTQELAICHKFAAFRAMSSLSAIIDDGEVWARWPRCCQDEAFMLWVCLQNCLGYLSGVIG